MSDSDQFFVFMLLTGIQANVTDGWIAAGWTIVSIVYVVLGITAMWNERKEAP